MPDTLKIDMRDSLPKKYFERGQALLIVLLSMAVILTVVLSIISRSVTDISLTTYSEEALRAFSAAEAGIERALIVGSDVSETVGDASFTADVSGLAEGSANFNYPVDIYSGESIYVWFVSHNPTTNLLTCSGQPCFTGTGIEICWANAGTAPDNASPAIEATFFYDLTQASTVSSNFANARITRRAYDANAGRRAVNNFLAGYTTGCSVGGTSYAFTSGTLALTGFPCYATPGCVLGIRIRSLYNSVLAQPVGVNVTGGLLPAQGRLIESTGTTTSQSSVRKIEAYRTYGGPAPIFDAAVFSEQTITKP